MQAVLSQTKFTTVAPQGNLNAANALEIERDLTTMLRHEDTQALLVSFQDVESFDSSGLMALVSSLKLAQSLNKRFSLCSVSSAQRIIFELTQLDRVFEILDLEAEIAILD
ncbi:anti-sigma factor antagonist [Calothrix sp. NIES-4101]|nr:anti-sigma factor antagonist [Calothrix sp. NIES-4101]